MARFVKEVGRNYNQFTPEDGPGSGSVTSVALTAPTGFTVTGSPITTSGTLALSFTTGYGIPPLMTGNSGKFLTTNGTTMSWVNIAGTDVTGAALTEVDDTNVTMTLGGTPSTALLRSVSMTLGWSGQLAVGRGGTGASTLTGVLIGNGTSAVTAVVGTAGQFLRRNTANTAYEFRTLQGGDIAGSELTFSNDTNVTMTLSGTPASALLQPVTIGLGWTGTLSVSRGGIGVGTITGVMIGNGTSAVTGVSGTANQILRRNAGNTAYEFWSANYMVNPMTLEGSLIYATTGGTPAELFANSTGTRKYLSQINGTAPTWEALSFPTGSGTTNYVAKWTSSTILGNSQIIDNGTNVGIGVSPSYKLDVSGDGRFSSLLQVNGPASVARADTHGISFFNGNLDYRISFDSISGTVGYIRYNVDTAFTTHGHLFSAGDFSATPTSLMLVRGDGNVGIGTLNPLQKLDVDGGIALSGTLLAARTTNYIQLYDRDSDAAIYLGGASAPTHIFDNTSHLFRSRAGSTTFTTISSAGVLLSSGHVQLPSANYITWGGAYGANIPTISGTSGTGAFLSFFPSGSSSGEKMRLSDTGQLKLNGYTSPTSYSGIVQGYLAFTSGGNIITTATPGGVSGTQNYLAKFDSTGIAVGNSRIVDDGTNFLLNGASSVVTGLNLVGGISATESTGAATILRRSAIPNANEPLGIIDGWGITTGSTYVWGGGIEIRASQNWNSTSAGTEIAIALAPDNTTTANDMFVFQNNGSVRFIGRTSNPIGAAAGTMYYNSSANNMRYYNGTSWITF